MVKVSETTLARSLAPEDIGVGDVVAVLREVQEVMAWECPVTCREIIVHRVATMPSPWDAGRPLKVRSVCLPFVHATDAQGESHTLDVRQSQLARLSRDYWRGVRGLAKKKAKASATPNG